MASGIKILIDPERHDALNTYKDEDLIDIIAIHGIGADPDRTWTGRGPADEEVNWLMSPEMLPKAVPNARIMRFGYQSNWFGTITDEPKKTFISDVADMLLKQLELYRRDRSRPIIFIAHSYGGLVLLQVLRRSFENPEKWSSPFQHTAGLVFFGTPFRGRSGLSLAEIVDAVAQGTSEKVNTDFRKYSDTMALSVKENPYLQDIVERYTMTRVGDHPIPLWCFYELLPSPVGKTLQNTNVQDGYLVPKESACLDTSKGINRHPLERHHYNLQKFPGPNDPGYKAVEDAIVRLARGAKRYIRESRAGLKGSYFQVPFQRNGKFTGRITQLTELKHMLFATGRDRAAIVGLGGMGKTHIALELAYQVREMNSKNETHPWSVLWMPAQSSEAFHNAASEVVQKLSLQYDNGDDPKGVLREYLASEAAGHWLLVVDNLDDTTVFNGTSRESPGLRHYLPRSATGRVLITTRSRLVADDTASGSVLELSAMSFEEAYSFMELSLVNKTQLKDLDETRSLLEKLAYFPLTLAQAAAYMNSKALPVAQYLSRWQAADSPMIELFNRQLTDDAHHSSEQGAVVTTWIVSFEAIRKANIDAVRLLSFIQWIDSNAIPVSMLPKLGSKPALQRSIDLLCEYGFLAWRADDESLEMHSLAHSVLRSWTGEGGENLMSEQDALRHLHQIFPASNWEQRTVWRQYLPHALPLLQTKLLQREEKMLDLSEKIGLCLKIDGRIKEAVEIQQHVVAIRTETLAENHPNLLDSQHMLASAYRDNGQIKEAIELLEHVVAIQKETLSENHPSRLDSQHMLASVYRNNGQIKEAIELLEHVVAIQKETLSENHPDRLASQHMLASVYQDNGQIKEAIELLEHVVAIQKETLSENHPSRLASQHVLASVYQNNGQIKEAIELLEHVVVIRTETLSENHPSRLASQHVLASVYQDNGQVKEAIELLEHAVAIQKETLSENHPDRLASQHMLASVYRNNGQIKEAIELLEHVVAIQKETLSENHPDRLASQHVLASVYQDNGQIKEAIELLEHVVAIEKETLSENHPSRLASQHVLASVYQNNGQIKEAIELLEHVVVIRTETLSENHPSRLASQHVLASVYQDNGQIKEAIELLEHVVAIRKETLSENHPDRLASQHMLANVYQDNGRKKSKRKHFFRRWKNKLTASVSIGL